MNSNIHTVRLALGGAAIFAAALATSACGSETAVEPEPGFVGGAPDAVTSGPSLGCSVSPDQAQRRIDAGQAPCGSGGATDDRPLGYGAAGNGHHPL